MSVPGLFVYGSLRRDVPGGRQDLLAAAALFRGHGRVRGRLLDLGEYPGLVASVRRDEWVRGELYTLPGATVLRAVDRYEDYRPAHPERSLFVRRMTTVFLDTGQRTRAWIYEYAGPSGRARRIPSGDYAARRGAAE